MLGVLDKAILVSHLLSLGAYFGATLYFALFVPPAAQGISGAAERQAFLAACFRTYNPLAIGAVGVQVLTGAFNLTRYKAALGPDFFARLGPVLAWKLGLVFLLVMLATYVSFGLGHRIVRYQQWGELLPDPVLAAAARRLRPALLVALALTTAIAWLSLGFRNA